MIRFSDLTDEQKKEISDKVEEVRNALANSDDEYKTYYEFPEGEGCLCIKGNEDKEIFFLYCDGINKYGNPAGTIYWTTQIE